MVTNIIKLVRYYIYAYVDLDSPVDYQVSTSLGIKHFNHQPIYIGKGRGERISSHCDGSKNEGLQNLIESKRYKYIILYDSLSNLESYRIECELIYKIGRSDLGVGPLMNKSAGIHLNESKGEIGPLNIEFNKLLLIMNALNTYKTKRAAAKALEISERTLHRYTNEYSLSKVDGEWMQSI